MIIKGCKSLLIIGVFIMLSVYIQKRTHGFLIRSIIFTEDEFLKKTVKVFPDKATLKILDQKFTYLDRGTQFYVFESEDKNYVIKFIRNDRLRPSFWVHFLRFPAFLNRYREEKLQDRMNKRARTFDACLLAYERLKNETGLVYIHLKPGDIKQKIALIDRIGREYSVDLQDTCFVIQKKAHLLADAIKKSSNPKKIIDSFIQGITYRCKMGVSNTDPNVFKNFGLLDGQAIEIDFGDFFDNHHLIQPRLYRHEVQRYVQKFRKWAIKEIPSLITYFDERVKREIEAYEHEKDMDSSAWSYRE